MLKIRIITLSILSLLLSVKSLLAVEANPQKDSLATVYVKVIEEHGKSRYGRHHDISYAHVRLIVASDTTAAITSVSGDCTFRKYKPGDVVIMASKVGYKTYRDRLQIAPGANVLYIKMLPGEEKLEAAVVKSEVPLVRQVKDTLVYNASAVSLMDGDKAVEILNRLPGVEVSGNRILVNGEEVARTYVNGVMIYGNDPSAAFYSLDASKVKEVKVYDEQSQIDRRKGLRHSRKQTVINVTTKEKIVSAVDILAAGSFGSDAARDSEGKLQSRYLGAAAANFYSEKFLAYVKFNAMNFTLDQGLMLLSPIRVLASPLNWRPQNSYSENMALSVGLHRFWGERVYGNNLKFDYSYGNTYDKSFGRSLTEYFRTDDNPAISYSDTTSSSVKRSSHKFSLDIELPDTPVKAISFENDFTISDSGLRSAGMSSRYEDRYMKYRNVSETDTSDEDLSYVGTLSWRDDDNARLTPSLRVNADLAHGSGDSWTVDTLATAFDRRHIHSESRLRDNSLSADAGISSVLKNTDKYTLSLNGRYSFVYHNRLARQNTVDLWQVVAPVVDVANTYDYTWNYYDHNASASFTLSAGKVDVFADLGLTYRTQVDEERFPEALDDSYDFLSFNPSVKFTWARNFQVGLSMRSQCPALEQLRNRIDDRNPFSLVGGNPDLRQASTGTCSVRYSAMKPSKWNLNAEVMATYSPSLIVRKQIYFEENTVLSDWNGYTALAGSMLNTFENASGAVTACADVSFKYFIDRKSSFHTSFVYSYGHAPQYVGEEKLMMNTQAPSVNLRYDYRNKFVSARVGARLAYQHFSNNAGQTLNESLIPGLDSGFSANFLKFCYGGANYSMAIYRNFAGAGSDDMNHILNAEVGVRLLKKKLSVSVSGHDLLNCASTYSNEVFNNYVVQRWIPSYGRYFMLTMKYDFSKTSGQRFRGSLIR